MPSNIKSGKGMSKSRGQAKNRQMVKKKAPTTKALDKKIKNIENNIIELKWFDVYDASEIVRSGTESLYHITPIAQGDQPYNRNANQVSATSLLCRYSVILPVGQRTPCYMRCIVFWDRQANVQPAPATTGSVTTGLLHTSTGAPNYLAFYNYRAKERYTVLYDKVFKIDQIGTKDFDTGTGNEESALNQGYVDNFYIKLNRSIKWGDESGTFPITNALYVYFTSNVAGADEAPDVQFNARLYYKDA